MLLAEEEKISNPWLAERGEILLRASEHNGQVKQGLNQTFRAPFAAQLLVKSGFRSVRAAVTVVTLFLLNLPNDKIVQLQNAFTIKYAPQ